MALESSGKHRAVTARETYVAMGVVVLGLIASVVVAVTSVFQSISASEQARSAETQAKAAQAEAHALRSQLAAQPSAQVLSIDGHATENGAHPYLVGSGTVALKYRFRAGNSGDEPVIVVHPLDGSRAYYPLHPGVNTASCSHDRSVRCASIVVGGEGDAGQPFTIYIYAVPPQINGEVNKKLDESETGGPAAQWTDLPAELAAPATSISVQRKP